MFHIMFFARKQALQRFVHTHPNTPRALCCCCSERSDMFLVGTQHCSVSSRQQASTHGYRKMAAGGSAGKTLLEAREAPCFVQCVTRFAAPSMPGGAITTSAAVLLYIHRTRKNTLFDTAAWNATPRQHSPQGYSTLAHRQLIGGVLSVAWRCVVAAAGLLVWASCVQRVRAAAERGEICRLDRASVSRSGRLWTEDADAVLNRMARGFGTLLTDVY